VPLLDNVRNFTGPGYARVVLDLSDEVRFQARKAGNRVELVLTGAGISPALFNRRFIIRDTEFLSRVTISDSAASSSGGVIVSLETSSGADYSAFQLSGPERLIIDLREAVSQAAAGVHVDVSRGEPSEESSAASSAEPRVSVRVSEAELARRRQAARNRDWGPGILSLPDVDVSNLDALENSVKEKVAESATAKSDSAKTQAGPQAGSTTSAAAPQSAGPIHCIVIDPGHGGHDTGTIGEGGLMEKDLVLEVGRRLRDFIKKYYPSIEVVMTRDSDRFIALEERTAIANSHHADLFMSIHANAAPSHVASGVETYYLSPDRASNDDLRAAARENATLAPDEAASSKPEPTKAGYEPSQESRPIVTTVSAANRVTESRELAGYIQSGLVRGIGSKDPRAALNRGVKHAPFYVLVGAGMPAVLAEISFVSNPKDEAMLRTAQYREHIAASLFAGLHAYLKKLQPAAPSPAKSQPGPARNDAVPARPQPVVPKKSNS
ncbi:MAG TPA: N-acetylmuramoyl-L-alanine amidase, partial [Blastocatellia bacterium]|nr:N-acetylmuramoyl-L-alanine amidase [Blastocatellia bacterium]